MALLTVPPSIPPDQEDPAYWKPRGGPQVKSVAGVSRAELGALIARLDRHERELQGAELRVAFVARQGLVALMAVLVALISIRALDKKLAGALSHAAHSVAK